MSKFTLTNYNHGDVLLNVYGDQDIDTGGCDIERITAADSAIDLFDLFTPSDLVRIACQAEAILDQQAHDRYVDDRIDQLQFARHGCEA